MLLLADVSALLTLTHIVDIHKDGFWEDLTASVEGGAFGFPRAVVDDLTELGRQTEVLGWAQGLGSALSPFHPNIKHQRWLMKRLQDDFDMEAGFESLYDRDPSIRDVALVARDFATKSKNFRIVTDDIGAGPLNPTTEELCQSFGWAACSVGDALADLGMARYLI